MYHLTRKGEAAPCRASLRACPSGQHYTSMEAAADAVFIAAVKPGTVPFGKYAGRPLEAMLADRGYCHWLAQQSWVEEDYPEVYRLIRGQQQVAQLRQDFERL